MKKLNSKFDKALKRIKSEIFPGIICGILGQSGLTQNDVPINVIQETEVWKSAEIKISLLIMPRRAIYKPDQ